MYQSIHEEIKVAGCYERGQFFLKKFEWRGKVYVIDQLTLMVNVKDGGIKQRIFSVQSGANIYRLLFNRETEHWYVEELWLEG